MGLVPSVVRTPTLQAETRQAAGGPGHGLAAQHSMHPQGAPVQYGPGNGVGHVPLAPSVVRTGTQPTPTPQPPTPPQQYQQQQTASASSTQHLPDPLHGPADPWAQWLAAGGFQSGDGSSAQRGAGACPAQGAVPNTVGGGVSGPGVTGGGASTASPSVPFATCSQPSSRAKPSGGSPGRRV